MFSFGSSHSGNTKRANSFSLSRADKVTSTKNSFPKRMPSNFKKQSPIPIAAVKKTGKSIRVLRQQDSGSGKGQDNFDSEKVTGETDYVNHNKRVYGLSQRSSPTYVKRSSMPFPKGRDSPEINKSYKSSVADDIIKRIRDSPEKNRLNNSSAADDIIRRIRATVSKENSASAEKNGNLSSNFKFRKSTDSLLPVWRQNTDKTKGEFKEDGSKRHPSIQDEKLPTRIGSRRGPTKHIYEKTNMIVEKSHPETSVLSRPPSKFIRRSPVPLSAIKQYIRPVPGIQETESTLTKENGGISRDSDGTSTFMENGSVLKDSPSVSEGQQNDMRELKLPELKKMAKSYGLKGYSTLRKGELLELLRVTINQS